jgi:hypothetical protein
MMDRILDALERLLFGRRALVLAVFTVVTLLMGWQAAQLRVDAGFQKLLPLGHPFIKTFVHYGNEFGGANKLLIALRAREGDIFTAEFFRRLRALTDEVFFLPGVNRTTVQSPVTPNVRFIEIVEGGFSGGNVVPADFTGTPEQLATVRENVLKAGIVGRLVANDFSAAMVSADLLEADPVTGERLDYIAVAHQLERKVRQQFEDDRFDVHIIGFAQMIGDIADGAGGVVVFFGVAFLVTAVMVYFFTHAFRLTVPPLVCAVVAVIWGLGLLKLLGFGLDPMTILVPFLVFAIGVSHGVQVVSAVSMQVGHGATAMGAARTAFRQLVVPGAVAVTTSTIGFLTLLLIDVQMVQELALTAGLGVAVMILTSLSLLPVLLSYLSFPPALRERIERSERRREPFWRLLASVTHPTLAFAIVVTAIFLTGVAAARARGARDTQAGVPSCARLVTTSTRRGHGPSDRRRPDLGDRRDRPAGVHRPRDHVAHRPLRVAHAQRPRGAVGRRAAYRGQGDQRRLERGQPQVARAAAHRRRSSVDHLDRTSTALNDDCSVMPSSSSSKITGRNALARHHAVQATHGARPPPPLHAGDGERRRHGRDERGRRRGPGADDRLGVRVGDRPLPGVAALDARDAQRRAAARLGLDPLQRLDGGPGDRAQGLDAADRRPRRRPRRRLRDLHLQPDEGGAGAGPTS